MGGGPAGPVAVAVALASCAGGPRPAAIRARVVGVAPGAYFVAISHRTADTEDGVDVAVRLAASGAAQLTISEHFLAMGDMVRDDNRAVDMRGRWNRAGDGIDVRLRLHHTCAGDAFDELPCSPVDPPPPSRLRLHCRALVPQRGSALPSQALVCGFPDTEPPARYTVTLDGARVLVVGGPRTAIQYSFTAPADPR